MQRDAPRVQLILVGGRRLAADVLQDEDRGGLRGGAGDGAKGSRRASATTGGVRAP